MELIKNKFATTVTKASKYTQFTIDEDFNVPDAKPDIEKIIMSSGNVIIENVEVLENKIRIMGSVVFKTLYQSVEKQEDVPGISAYENEIFFEEAVNADGVMPGDKIENIAALEDLYVTMINSRKLEARGLVGIKLAACSKVCVEGATGIQNGSGIECRMEKLPFTNNVASNKDILKIKEDIELPAGKPNIERVIWEQVSFRDIEAKITDGQVHIKGMLELFVIYTGESGSVPFQYVNTIRTFEGDVPCPDGSEGMILNEYITPGKGSVTVKSDSDGEDRILQVEYGLNIDMKVYEDMELNVLADMYSPSAEIELDRQELCYENLLLKNNAKTKTSAREKIKAGQPPILQIANVTGTVETDDVNFYEDSIGISGAVKAAVLYISSDDTRPIAEVETVIPFTYKAERAGLDDNDIVHIIPAIAQITGMLIGSDEIELKVEINLNISIFAKECTEVISDMRLLPVNWERKAEMPGITGYIVKDGDTIWSIAKKCYSSIESIRKVNELTSDNIKAGDKLIVVKN